MRAVGSTEERLRRTEVAEFGWETRTGSVKIWAGAGADQTRVSEAHCSGVVAERAGIGAGTKDVARGDITGHGLGMGTKRGQKGGAYGHKILWTGGVQTLCGDANKGWGEMFLIVNLNPAYHRLHWLNRASETYPTPKIPSLHPSHVPQVDATPVWRCILFSHRFPPAGCVDWCGHLPLGCILTRGEQYVSPCASSSQNNGPCGATTCTRLIQPGSAAQRCGAHPACFRWGARLGWGRGAG